MLVKNVTHKSPRYSYLQTASFLAVANETDTYVQFNPVPA